jgi:hypothetical protein
MTGQQQYLRKLARRSGLYYCIRCGEEPPMYLMGLCKPCAAGQCEESLATEDIGRPIGGAAQG